MYTDYYNLTAQPFENTPDPHFFYASEQHREALAAIEYTIRMRKGFVMITGEIGAGKTTIGRVMIERCADSALIVPVLHGHTTREELLRQTMRCLNVPHRVQDDHARLLERLHGRLSEQAEHGSPIVLLVDEAQSLSDEALEELRLLSNFDTATEKLVQVVLIGHPELRQRVRTPALTALRQRIAMAKQLQPLSLEETGTYIRHRLRIAAVNAENVQASFSEKAIAEIHRFSGGVPRLINFVCDNCLLLAFVREHPGAIPQTTVRQVINDMLPCLNGPSKPEFSDFHRPAPEIVTVSQVASQVVPMLSRITG